MIDDSKQFAAATAEMEWQASQADGYSYSLDGMWRACGCPESKGPDPWLVLARPLIEGVGGYWANLDRWTGGLTPSPDEEVVYTLTAEQEPDSPYRTGDRMAPYFVAIAYAAFLDDGHAVRDRTGGRLVEDLDPSSN
jgi:hypothetical protein